VRPYLSAFYDLLFPPAEGDAPTELSTGEAWAFALAVLAFLVLIAWANAN
jgi:hypothetical protein